MSAVGSGCAWAVSVPELTGGTAAPVDAGVGDSETGPPSPTSAYARAILGDQPLAYWRMEPDAVGEVADETANGNPLSVIGTTKKSAGAISGDVSNAIVFESGYATAKNSRAFDFDGRAPFTLEVWARYDGGGEEFQHLISCADEVNGAIADRQGWTIYFFEPAALKFAIEWDIPGTQYVSNATAAPAGTWAHYVAVFDGERLVLYVNGLSTREDPVGPGLLTPRTASFIVGASRPGSKPFAGALDEIAIYSRALDASVIARHHRLGTSRP